MGQRFEGRNLDEALTNASHTLGVERWQLTHHTLLEKRGFLGGMKRVVIDVEINTDAAPPVAAAAPPLPAARPATESRPAAVSRPAGDSRPVPPPSRGPRGDRNRGGRGGRDRGERGQSRPRRDRRPLEDREELQPGDFEKFLEDMPEQSAESESARSVHEWCQQVLSLAKLSLEVRTGENDTQIIVRVYGRDAQKLVENHGELLDAIQVLANKALVGRRVEKEIELDCGAFKDRRTEELEQRARDVAERVRRGGREELLPAMTPIERRIVHLALRDDAEVTTESRGDGFYKRVAVIPRPATPEPEPAPEP